jgi:hypothetical protein
VGYRIIFIKLLIGMESVILGKRMMNALIPALFTCIVLMLFFFTVPAVFLGSVFYSIILDTIPKSSSKPLFRIYLKHAFFYYLSSALGWGLYLFLNFEKVNLLNSTIYLPALYSLLYYKFLLLYHYLKNEYA